MTQNLARRFLTLAVLMTIAASTLVTNPVAAELTPPQATSWGLEGEGATENLDRWEALGWATEQVGGMMLVGGKFLEVTNGSQSVDQPWIAAFDAGSGNVLPWWRPDVGGAVLAIENSPDGGVFVGGEMNTWNGQQLGSLVKIDPETGDTWPGFNSRVFGGNSVVRDIRLEADGWLYVVGNFTTASSGGNPQAVQGAIRMNPNTGAIDWNWLPAVEDGSVWGVSVSPARNEVYLAGWFTSVDGQPNTDGFAGVSDTDGSVLRNRSTIPYNTCVGCTSYFRLYDVIATEFGQVWVGGEQHALFILDESDLELDRMHWTGCDLSQQPDCSRRGGEFQELERSGNRIYASGHFWGSHRSDTDVLMHSVQPQIATQTGTATGLISAVGAYDVSTGIRDQSFNPKMSGDAGGFAMAVATDGCLWLTGGVSQVGEIGNQTAARDLVRLCDEGGAGADPQPNPTAPVPVSCTATVDGTTVDLAWTVPEFATDVVVYRAIDDRSAYWRARVPAPGTAFSEEAVDGSLNSYEVRAKYPTGVLSPPAACEPPIDLTAPIADDVAAPATCSAVNTGIDATISWTASPGATDYRVYRSIDNGPSFWRGLTDTTSFGDTLRNGGLHDYIVQARGASGVWSPAASCTPTLDPADGGVGNVSAPATCSATNVGVAASVNWEASDGAESYRVFRSIDAGATYWRGLVTTTNLDDTLRTSGSHVYSVQARGANGVWSGSTTCSPVLDPTDGGPEPVAAPTSCSATAAAGTGEITWAASPDATDYRVFRSVDAGSTFWRGLSTTTNFTDDLRTGSSHVYSVQARGVDGVWSASTVCAPPING